VTGVAVRPVGPEDWPAVREIRLAALADAPEAFKTTVAQARAWTEQDWRDAVAATATFLVETAGQPVGMASGVVRGSRAEVIRVWVAASARGRGAVAALLEAVAGWARGLGHEELVLWVVDGNSRAEHAYHRFGFRRTGRSQPVPGRPGEVEVEMVVPLG
jgi:GNAT superfamily N-acetyltransferase